nr:MAG TPA: hypothetical protein [Bacteriophage sp.]
MTRNLLDATENGKDTPTRKGVFAMESIFLL